MTVSQDAVNSPFGFQLSEREFDLDRRDGYRSIGPAKHAEFDLGRSRAESECGDTISFGLTLPDGSSQTITLQATTASPPGTNQFTIGATPADTATNLQAALTTSVGNLDQTALPAASAMAAANNFFSSDPPQRVNATAVRPIMRRRHL